MVREGVVRKFLDHVEQITYPVRRGVAERDQKALVITERAVFRAEAEGLAMIEVAKGIDVRRDILGQMAFEPYGIADPLPVMDFFAVCGIEGGLAGTGRWRKAVGEDGHGGSDGPAGGGAA